MLYRNLMIKFIALRQETTVTSSDFKNLSERLFTAILFKETKKKNYLSLYFHSRY